MKKKTKKSASKRTKTSRVKAKIYGVEHDFIIITGGGLLILVLSFVLFA